MKEVGDIFFISKKDAFYSVAIWGAIVLSSFTFIYPSIFILSISNLIGLIFGLLLISWLIWIWFGTGYRVENNKLIIQGGPLKQTLDIQEIQKITKEKSILTAAALSIDRLKIQYGKYKYVGISPKKEYEFIKLSRSKNPQIQIDDDLLKRHKL